MFWGTGLLIYLVMVIVVPEARSPEEKAAASGDPLTAQEFIRRAKEGYYEAMKGFPDRNARREWKRRFKRDMRASGDQWRHNWHCHWAERAPVHPGMGFALPLLSLLQGRRQLRGSAPLISLLTSGAVFGLALPANVPVWVAALLAFIAYGMVSCPLKLARRACYLAWDNRAGSGPWYFFWTRWSGSGLSPPLSCWPRIISRNCAKRFTTFHPSCIKPLTTSEHGGKLNETGGVSGRTTVYLGLFMGLERVVFHKMPNFRRKWRAGGVKLTILRLVRSDEG